jgi:heterotetrameric sarcosine oxidase gamma subunit
MNTPSVDCEANTAPGVRVRPSPAVQVVRMAARRGRSAELISHIQAHFGIELPLAPQRVCVGSNAFIGISPGAWLATADSSDEGFTARFQAAVAGAASLCDLSDAYLVSQLSGRQVLAALAKLVPIDLHARNFAVGRVALTNAAHVPVMLWRLPDQEDPVYELAVPRSYALYIQRTLAL